MLDPLKLELLMAVSHHLSAGNQIWAFCKNKSLSCYAERSLQLRLYITFSMSIQIISFLFVNLFYIYLVCFNFLI